MRKILVIALLGSSVALSDVYFRNGATRLGPVTNVACGDGLTCVRDAGIGVINAVPATAITGSGYILMDGGYNINWIHGLACGSGAVLTTSGTSAMQCVTAITTATNLATNPAPCDAGTFVNDMGADGTLTCSVPGQPGSTCAAGSYATSISTTGVLTCSVPYTHPSVSWTACTFKDSGGVNTPWENYNTATHTACAQFTDADGRCHVRGRVKPKAETDGGLIITVLDGNCDPLRIHTFAVLSDTNVILGLDVGTSADATLSAMATSWVSLDGITIDRAANP